MSTPPFIALPPEAIPTLFPSGAQAVPPVSGLLLEPRAAARGSVLLVPGFTGSKEDFIALLVPLADRGYRAVAIDLPGQNGAPAVPWRNSKPVPLSGLSPLPAEDEEALAAEATLGDLAQGVRAAADSLAGSGAVHVVGHSLGGLVTRQMLLDNPQLLSEGTRAVATWTALDSGPGAVPARHRPALKALLAAMPTTGLADLWGYKEAQDRRQGWLPPSAEVLEFLRRRFVSNDPGTLQAMAAALLSAPDRTSDLARALRDSSVRVAVGYGEDDDIWTLAEQQQVARTLGVEPFVVRNAGHSPAAEQPELLASHLARFFEEAE
jgi:pimeloyl-ACP methyl ester carboxylesterase